MSEPSCSDCKIELIEKQWTKLLLKWINKCIYESTRKEKNLNYQSLADIMAKYNKDVCADDIDRAMLCTDDVEPFINYKYPILRLKYLSELSDIPIKLYITTSIVLYHCCMNSQTGTVDKDICKELAQYEQELIIKFCENLLDMEATVHNVGRAIRNAFESVGLQEIFDDSRDQLEDPTTSKGFAMSLASDKTIVPDTPSIRQQTMHFKPITVLPSVLAESSSYSDLESDDMVMIKKNAHVNFDDNNMYTNKDKAIKYESKNEALNEEAPSDKPHKSRKLTHDEKKYAIEQAISNQKLFEKWAKKMKEAEAINNPDVSEKPEDSENNSQCQSDSTYSASDACCGDFCSYMAICKSNEKGKIKKSWNFYTLEYCVS